MSNSHEWSPSTPPRPFYYGAEEGGFAYPTVIKRWPVIVTDCINTVIRHSNSDNGTAGSAVIAQLSALKYELDRLKVFTFVKSEDDVDDGLSSFWTDAIQRHFPSHAFLTASWLFAECLLYARINASFRSQPLWANFDPFLDDKLRGFRDLQQKVILISDSHELLIRSLNGKIPSENVFKSHLRDLVLLSLWGNATDLSMFAGLSEKEIEQMRSGASGEENIISNHIPDILAYIASLNKTGRTKEKLRIDFVLDNSGFELFSDLLLADYLHQAGYIQETVFHCKTMPWFVSDTMPSDFEWLVNALENPAGIFQIDESSSELENLKLFGRRCRNYLKSGSWKVTSNRFWCTYWAHHHLKTEAPDVFDDIQQNSCLCIFKGDLNYRKLVYDCKWEATTPFMDVLGSLKEFKAVMSLRTNKSDPIVGLPSDTEESFAAKGVKDWRWSGKFAVVEFYSQDSLV